MNAINQPVVVTVAIGDQQPLVFTTVAPAPIQQSVKVAKPTPSKSELHRTNLQEFLFKQVGKFVTLDFVKVDGSARSLNGRLGVKKHLKGGSNTVSGLDKPYLVVYDVKTKGYRAVNLATVMSVRAQKVIYTVIG